MREQIQAEISAVHLQIQALRQERNSIQAELISAPEHDSPEAIVAAYRSHARETAQLSAEVKGIDDAIAALVAQVEQKQAELVNLQIELSQPVSLEELVEIGKNRAQVHAERINQLAAELTEELRALKAEADEISPSYWQVYYKPFITGFQSITVPHVRTDAAVWAIANRLV